MTNNAVHCDGYGGAPYSLAALHWSWVRAVCHLAASSANWRVAGTCIAMWDWVFRLHVGCDRCIAGMMSIDFGTMSG